MTARNPWFYTIQSSTSRDSTIGLRPKIGPMFSAADLIRIAADECTREGTTLEGLAGIEWIEDQDGNSAPARPWNDGEELQTAVDKLDDDGKLFEVFEVQKDCAAYYDRAAELGLQGDLQDDVIANLDPQRLAAYIMGRNENQDTLEEFFVGVASCEYYDGSSYQLYLDTDDWSLSIHHEASSNSWLQRDDGSMIQVHQVSGYCDIPEDERYTDGCDLDDYGYVNWLGEIEQQIAERLRQR